jgi:SAM-dependent methyltransferase
MASSNLTYDVELMHDPLDALTAASLRRQLLAAGRRSKLTANQHALVPFESQSAVASSRVTVHLIGAGGLSELTAANIRLPASGSVAPPRSLVLLLPSCNVEPSDIPRDASIVDLLDIRQIHAGPRYDRSCFGTPTGVVLRALRGYHNATALHPTALWKRTIWSYDRIADMFSQRWFEHPPLVALDKFAYLLPRRARVLDAGCGPGHHAKYLGRLGFDVLGIDLSWGMLSIARRRVPTLDFHHMDARRLAFPDSTFDGVWCAAMALHVPKEELLNLLSGFRRVLRPHGLLGINMQVGRPSEVVNIGADHRFFEYYRDSREIGRFVRRSGFRVVAEDYGETNRNTHGLDLTLKWVTLYAEPAGSRLLKGERQPRTRTTTGGTDGSTPVRAVLEP